MSEKQQIMFLENLSYFKQKLLLYIKDIYSLNGHTHIKNEIVDLDIKNPNYNENNPNSPSYIENRPFYADNYDYVLTVLTEFKFEQNGIVLNDNIVYMHSHFNDNLYEVYSNAEYKLNWNEDQQYLYCQEIDGMLSFGNYALKTGNIDDDTGEDYFFYTNGVGYVILTTNIDYTSITEVELIRKEEIVQQIDEKFLPYSATAQADAAEGDSSSPSYIHNMPCREYYNYDYNWIYDWVDGSTDISADENKITFPNQDSVILIEGENYRIHFYCVGETEESFVDEYDIYPEISTLLEINGVIFEFTEESITVTMDTSVHTFTQNNTYYIMLARKEWINVVEKLDMKFIPDEVMQQHNWDENDPNSPAYINGRTHYVETTYGEPITIPELVFSEYQTRENGEVIYSASGVDESFILEVGQMYVVQYPYGWCAVRAEEYNGMIVVGDKYLINESEWQSGEGFFIAVDGTGNYTVYDTVGETIIDLGIESETNNVVQLDEMYIPDSIARIWDIPEQQKAVLYDEIQWLTDEQKTLAKENIGIAEQTQVDMYQVDPQAIDYVKNNPIERIANQFLFDNTIDGKEYKTHTEDDITGYFIKMSNDIPDIDDLIYARINNGSEEIEISITPDMVQDGSSEGIDADMICGGMIFVVRSNSVPMPIGNIVLDKGIWILVLDASQQGGSGWIGGLGLTYTKKIIKPSLIPYIEGIATEGFVNEKISSKQDVITGIAGQFVVIGEDGGVTTMTIPSAMGVSF